MNRLFYLVLLSFCICGFVAAPASAAVNGNNAGNGRNYSIKKVADGIYAAIALPKGKANSNAMFIVSNSQVIMAGAHFTNEGTRELIAEVSKITAAPLKTVILTHHHRGYNYIDYDFPAGVEIITSWQTWQSLSAGYREIKNPVTFFEKGLTMRRGNTVIVLSNAGLGHSQGDLIVYLPNEKILFTSDLFFNDQIGYMGDGYMREWVLTLEMLEGIDARTVIPGVGNITDIDGIRQFRLLFKDFLTEVLRHVEKGETLAQTKKGFHLPGYEALPGFKVYFNGNLERAYQQLKEK